MVGQIDLADLPLFIGACALFVGNDSGPKHIAAGLGVPTVGVHSGVIDAREFGPIGRLAVAIKRDVVCSPCYLDRIEDCHRGHACLQDLDVSVVLSTCRRMLRLRVSRASTTGGDFPARMERGDVQHASLAVDAPVAGRNNGSSAPR